MAQWTVTNNGSVVLDGVEVDVYGPKPDLKQACVEACAQIRKGKHVRDILSLSAAPDSIRGVPVEPGGTPFYQPIGRVVFTHMLVEGKVKKSHFFAIVAVDEGSQMGHPDAKYRCHIFKCRTEHDANEVAYATGRTMVHLSNATKRRPINTLQNASYEELSAAVKWWNANNPVLYHYELSNNGIISGNIKFSCQTDPSVKAMQKVVRLTNQAVSQNLVKLLADKFNITSELDDFAVFHLSHDSGQQNMLQPDESPISMSVCFQDPNAGSFCLQKIPAGLVRATAPRQPKTLGGFDTGESTTDGDEGSEEGPLGPLLPYNADDEDLLLNVMIARQSGTGLGFKLTPAYLLQMCIAFAAKQGDDPLRRLLGKIAAQIRQVVQANPSVAELLLFWISNGIKLVSSVQKDTHVSAVFSESTKQHLDTTIDLALSNLRTCVQSGASLGPAISSEWKSIQELRAAITDYVRSMDQEMSHANLREVVQRITEAMPSQPPPLVKGSVSAGASSEASSEPSMTSTPLRNEVAPPQSLSGSQAAAQNDASSSELPALPSEWEELIDPETGHRFFANHETEQTSWIDPRDRLVTVTLVKNKKGLGVGISGAKKTTGDGLVHGIFVSSLMPGSPAAEDGRLREGDEILEVDGHGLIGVTRDGAIEFLKQVQLGDSVRLLVAQEPRGTLQSQQSDKSMRHTAL
eukprot:m.482014 g.482014  ORF g.482014 m.482014 type:complete len:690 (+) comp22406_c0_seq1:477-2546(+)